MQNSSSIQNGSQGLNGILLGIHEVFNASEQDDYLRERFAIWNIISAPLGYQPHLNDLPPVHHEEKLCLGSNAKVTEQRLEAFRTCAGKVLDDYFPLIGNESVVKDILTFTDRQYHSHPPGTGVVIRRTNKAVLFYIDQNIRVEADGPSVTNILVSQYQPEQHLIAASPTEEAKIVTDVLSQFAEFLPGPFSSLAKCGLSLLSMALGKAGENGPSWEEITAMMRQVVRDELITNDLEYIQADYESIKKWSDIQYIPNREKKSKEKLWGMLSPQINLVSKDINLLLQPNHRIPGFGLLLLGVDIYLCLLQEQISLGYDAEIKKAGDHWATNMLQVWNEVQANRAAQYTVEKHVANWGTGEWVSSVAYWRWTDTKTNVGRGSKHGPWLNDDKEGKSKAACQANYESYYQNNVLPFMKSTFGNPEATANAWRTVAVPR